MRTPLRVAAAAAGTAAAHAEHLLQPAAAVKGRLSEGALPVEPLREELSEDFVGVATKRVARSWAGPSVRLTARVRRWRRRPAGLQPCLAVPVEDGALLGVRQHVVGLGNLLELLLGRLLLRLRLTRPLVGVPLDRRLAIGLLDVIGVSVPRDTEQYVVVAHSPFGDAHRSRRSAEAVTHR